MDKVKSSSLAYNRRETRDRRLLSRDPGWSRCHLHSTIKLFWSQPMAPWISAAAYEWIHGLLVRGTSLFIKNICPAPDRTRDRCHCAAAVDKI